MWVKICANTNLEDAQTAAELGADAVGFVFAPSKRQVTTEQVSVLTRELGDGVEKVGVFATDDPREIARCVERAGLTAAQLHGAFDAAMVQALAEQFGGKLKIIQTAAYVVDAADRAASDAQFARTLEAVFDESAVWAVLIDAAKSGTSGGLGVAFDWAHVAEIVRRAIGAREPRPRVILAGGLNAENVAQAIATLKPWGVDVASGVEASPGKKNQRLVRRFIESARDGSSSIRR